MKYFAFSLMALLLSACVTVSNTLSPDQVATFKLTQVSVSAAPDAQILWGDGDVAYASTKGVPAHEALSLSFTPEAQAYLRQSVSAKLRTVIESELAGRLQGTRPVRLQVTIRRVEIASVLQRILIGGHHTLRADAVLIDAKTGAVLSQFPGQSAMSMAGQGIAGSLVDAAVMQAPIDRVTKNYAELYRNWLLGV